MKDFDDNFSEGDVLRALDNAGLRYKNGSRYITTCCPFHEEKNPSAQIFKDDWFVNCMAGCGRHHITKAFPELSGSSQTHSNTNSATLGASASASGIRVSKMAQNEYIEYDLFDTWRNLPEIPVDFKFKSIPVSTLNGLGWRMLNGELPGMGNGIFMPYFDFHKKTIPFGQTRHLTGDRRFTFLAGARPTMYGKWNIDNAKLFLVEGASDAAVMQECGLPWIAAPSASSGAIVHDFALFCKAKNISLVYAGDRDAAGDKLKEELDKVIPYRVCQVPAQFKDWGDYFEAVGSAAVLQHCIEALFE